MFNECATTVSASFFHLLYSGEYAGETAYGGEEVCDGGQRTCRPDIQDRTSWGLILQTHEIDI